jgi:hypothetical protein
MEGQGFDSCFLDSLIHEKSECNSSAEGWALLRPDLLGMTGALVMG